MQELNIHRLQTQVNIDADEREYHLPIASATQLGGIKVGDNLTIEEDGTLNAEATEYHLPFASTTQLGGVIVGDNLSISDGLLSVPVDSVLSTTSAHPVQNSTITSNINTINGDITSLGSRVGILETTTGTITNTVSGIQGSITSIDDAVDTLSGDLSDLSSTVSGYSSAITQNTNDISALTTRVGTVEGVAGANTLDITALKELVDDEQSYSYLLPVSTWSDGSIVLERRGKVGVLYINIEGSLILAAGASTTVYSYTDLGLYTPAFANILSDAGAVLGIVDDETNNFTVKNLSSTSITITKLQGSIPLIFS